MSDCRNRSLNLIERFVVYYSELTVIVWCDVHVYEISIQSHTQLQLPATNKKELECQFHSADYHVLSEVASGLRNATEYLVKV